MKILTDTGAELTLQQVELKENTIMVITAAAGVKPLTQIEHLDMSRLIRKAYEAQGKEPPETPILYLPHGTQLRLQEVTYLFKAFSNIVNKCMQAATAVAINPAPLEAEQARPFDKPNIYQELFPLLFADFSTEIKDKPQTEEEVLKYMVKQIREVRPDLVTLPDNNDAEKT